MSKLANCTPFNRKEEYKQLVQQYKLNLLLANVKKSIELWFLTGMRAGGTASISYDQIANTCVEILKNGLHLQILNDAEKRKTLCKLQDDFEWLRRSAQIRDCQPTITTTTSSISTMENVQNFLYNWTLFNLKSNCLCASIQALLAERDLLEYYYPQESAFLRNENYATALFICLSALELNQYSLLSQVDAKLCDLKRNMPTAASNGHKRTTSHPNFSLSPPKPSTITLIVPATKQSTLPFTFRRVKSLPHLLETEENHHHQQHHRLPATTILPRKRSKTIAATNATNISTSTLNSNNSLLLKGNSSTGSFQSDVVSMTSSNSSYTTAKHINVINCDDIKIWTDYEWEQQQQQQQHKTNQPSGPCAIPQNVTQSKNASPISSFLSSVFRTPPGYTSWAVQQKNTNTEDSTVSTEHSNDSASFTNDIENTTLCRDTKIGSVFDVFLPAYGKKPPSQAHDLFETGISYLDYSQPSTSRGAAQRQVNEPISMPPKNCESLMAFLQMSKASRTDTELDKENAHFRVSEAIIATVEHIKWTRLQSGEKLASKAKVDEEHIAYAEVSGVEEFAEHSAEELGIALLSKFHEKTQGSELKWLVADGDTPQELLPLPAQFTPNPDGHFMPSLTRGTPYWAPPRPQIIFTDHPTPNRKKLVLQQNNRCAGCGMVVSAQFVRSFRYCTYLGKYLCTGCHRNQMSPTPAKILRFWDFTYYPVCSFAYRLLDQMYACPLFNVADLNPALYEQQSKLSSARRKRFNLKFLRDFIVSCRFAVMEQKYFAAVPEYLTAEPDLWSINDFFDVKQKRMQRSIDELIECCEKHIFNCILCSARGFLCEYCHKDTIIYPWQSNVYRCDYCGTCYHHKCCKLAGMPKACLRCQRINKRQEDVADAIEMLT